MKKDSLIILSGGMDSVTLLYEMADRIALAVNFNYGSNHNAREASMARTNCDKLGIELIEIDLAFIGKYFRSSLLEGADAIPDGKYDETNIHSTVVPFRNGIMLSVAAGIAESRGIKFVMMANHGGDHTIYPDCRQEFVTAMDSAIMTGTYQNIRLVAPYTNITKADIARIGSKLGIDYALTYSCYRGGEVHCGTCATCRERKEAFRVAGIQDPTTYICSE